MSPMASNLSALAKDNFVWFCDIVASVVSPSSPGRSLCDLPDDILHLIAQHVAPTKPLYIHFRQRDIVALSSTSRAVRAICLPYVFRDLRLRFAREADARLACTDPGLPPSWPRTVCEHIQRQHAYRADQRPSSGVPTLEAFLRFIEDSPHIAPLVRVLALALERPHCGERLCADVDAADRAIDSGLLCTVLERLPSLQALQLVDVPLRGVAESTPGHIAIEHLRISYSRGARWDGDTQHVLDALYLFREVGTLHLSPLLTSESGSGILFSSNVMVRSVFLRNPWPMQGTLAALAAAPRMSCVSLDLGDPWAKRVVQRNNWDAGIEDVGSVVDEDTIDEAVVLSLRGLLVASGDRLSHLGLGAMTFAHSIFLAGVSTDRVIHDITFACCPELQSLAITVSISSQRPARTESMLENTARLLESLERDVARLPSLRLLTLNFEVATLQSVHGSPGHQMLIRNIDTYKHIFDRIDTVLSCLVGTLDVFFAAGEAVPCNLDVEAFVQSYIPRVLPTAWGKIKPVRKESPWAMQQRLSMA